ncbi:hypothetical protein [Shigella flexneri]|nr:hypothetical protein [Shigella flexneri]
MKEMGETISEQLDIINTAGNAANLLI